MDYHNSMGEGYSTDSSSEKFCDVHLNVNPGRSDLPVVKQAAPTVAVNLDSESMHSASAFGTQFQEFIMRALLQSTAALVGPLPGVLTSGEGGSSGSPLLCTQVLSPASTWNEATFNKAEGRRRRKPQMQRTSAGENSDSQADIQVLENETPQQKSWRGRRLNRFRTRRAKELTNNRKALNKVPYVIHIDGMGKAKGIHRHQWRAAVRGQCGRLDPSMDNINHHPKHIVDSIWHGLEKEWEFEGFTHRAREMFEKSATKCMRNRKMQLKYKFAKSVKGKKPNDVSGSHWSKIVDIAKKSAMEATSSASRHSTAEGNEKVLTHVLEDEKPPLQLLSRNQSPNAMTLNESMLLEEDDVDARILSLQRELLVLQKSRKIGFHGEENLSRDGSIVPGEQLFICPSNEVFEGMKENVRPRHGNAELLVETSSRTPLYKPESWLQGKGVFLGEEKKKSSISVALSELQEDKSTADISTTQMECGDVVRLFAITDGIEKEIAKGIVMGLAGSKHARKVIPQGWRIVKVTSYTCFGANAVCPLPRGWTEEGNNQTMKEASGRVILWPDLLLHSLL